MFHTMPQAVRTPRLERLRQIPPDTGKFLALMAARAVGYAERKTITTFEVLPEKIALARETFALAGVEDVITLVAGDAREALPDRDGIAFCFLDAEKEVYADCYEAVVPNLVPGGLLVADNAINHRETLQPMLDRALSDARVDALIVPIGAGELVCRKL